MIFIKPHFTPKNKYNVKTVSHIANVQHPKSYLDEHLILTQLFIKPIYILRFIGVCPVKFHKAYIPNTSYFYYTFHFNWLSIYSIYSAIGQLAALILTYILVSKILSGDARMSHMIILFSQEFENGKNTTVIFTEYIATVYAIQYFICVTSIILTTFLTAPQLVTLLNRWSTQYLTKFTKVFPKSEHILTFSKLKTKFTRKHYWNLLFVFAYMGWVQLLTFNCLIGNHNNICTLADIQVNFINLLCGFPSALMITMHVAMVQGLTDLVLEALKQIKKATISSKQRAIHFEYFKLIYFVRRQYKLVEKVCGPAILILSAYFFTTTITNWIIVLWLIKGEVLVSVAISTLAFSLLQINVYLRIVRSNRKVLRDELEIMQIVMQNNNQERKDDTFTTLRDKFEVKIEYYC